MSKVYASPDLYELAFSYRDYRAECDRLEQWYREVSAPTNSLGARTNCGERSEPAGRSDSLRPGADNSLRVLELAAGPSDHALELARRGHRAAALDLSASMCEYARSRARRLGLELDVYAADMSNFQLDRTFDLVFVMLSSVSHLMTWDSLVSHLTSVARHLSPDGLFLIETTHPADFLGRGSRSTGVGSPWVMKSGARTLKVKWGSPDDPYDVLKQVFDAHVRLELEEDGAVSVFEDHFPMRDFTLSELSTAAREAGLTMVRTAGDFERDLPLDHGEAWRMILMFQKARV
ncbi:MAG: class I SAM-dependent methyltransferase [Deltaproteobacteria bacterium]|nr:class I SAM-dependent methyltransferase [Deltaproteobacteria bacterium]